MGATTSSSPVKSRQNSTNSKHPDLVVRDHTFDYDNSGIEYLKAQEIPQLFQDITDIFVDSQQHINHSHQLIEAGTIKQDPKQDRVLELIDQLYVQIESYSPPSLPSKPCPNCASGTFNKPRQETKTQKRSLWNSFFGSSE
eukprot:359165_1